MKRVYQSSTSRLAAAAVVAAAVASGGYLLLPAGAVTAQSPGVSKPAPAEAVNHANALSAAFRYSADRALPAVVSIRNEVQPKMVKRDLTVPRDNRPQMPKEFGELDPFLKRFFDQLPEGGQFDMPQSPRHSSGSGVIIDSSGVILTNNHVVTGGGKVTVELHDGREFVADKVITDPSTDIAVVLIKGAGSLPTAKLGNSDDLQIGDWVLAVGQPFGLPDTVTAGIISAKGRGIGMMKHEEFLQTDAAINPGNSGGPLVNLNGEVIGINTAISSSSGGFQGVGFAVPVNVAKWVSSQLLKDGKVHRAYIGVGIQEVDQALASQLGMSRPYGALVTEVQPNSPAAQAGLQTGDVILKFGGQTIEDRRSLSALAGRSTIGASQPLVALRDGKELTLHVAVREAPDSYGVKATRPAESTEEPKDSKHYDKLGLQVGPLTSDVAKQLGLADASGAVITAVEDGSPADKAGLQPSMVITRVGHKAVKSVAEFEAEAKSASLDKGLLLLVRSAEGSRFVVIKGE
jgi:serine protease Do